MAIRYLDFYKDLPIDQLHRLFVQVGWAPADLAPDEYEHFNLPFLNATLVVSAWKGDRLVGVARVLSDQITRSVLYDLAVEPEHQGQGIGSELLRLCMARWPHSQWMVQAEPSLANHFEKQGFTRVAEGASLLLVKRGISG